MKGGYIMIYTPKWISENMGISQDMIKNYRRQKLLLDVGNKNPHNNYREYTERDIERLWAIKTLISMEFTTSEIKAFMNDFCFDFYGLLDKKIEELEKKKKRYSEALDFAKTIKVTGRVPITSEMGNMRFEEFEELAKKEWNLYSDPKARACAEMAEIVVKKPLEEWGPEEQEKQSEFLEMLDQEDVVFFYNMNAYCNLLVELSYLKPENEVVQKVVTLLYKCFEKEYGKLNVEVPITPKLFSEQFSASFISGDAGIIHERKYGKDGVNFIYKAVKCLGENRET